MLKQKEFSSRKRLTVFLLTVALLCGGGGLHAVPYLWNRSLWIDEAMLASSVLTRGFSDLVLHPLDWGQSSPIGWLYIVKSLTALFGSEEYVLRFWSLLSFVCMVSLAYVLMKSLLRVKYPEVFTAIIIFLPFYARYSNEFKPYMSDNMFVVLSLLLFGLYAAGKISLHVIVCTYSAIIWFSFASVFFIASAMIVIVAGILHDMFTAKDKTPFASRIAECMIAALSFGLNYKLWLSESSANAGAPEYWALLKFIFVPSSLQDVKTMYKMMKELAAPILSIDKTFAAFIIILAAAGLIRLFMRKESRTISIAITGSMLMMCIASRIGFYPISARLVQFVSIELLILAAAGFDAFDEGTGSRKLTALIMFVFLFVPFMKTLNSVRPSHVYMNGTEAAENIRYLRSNLTSDDVVYVSNSGIPLFLYESGYSYSPLPKQWTDITLPLENSKCILGRSTRITSYTKPYVYDVRMNFQAIDEETDRILKHKSVYIFSSHNDRGVPFIAEKLKQYGTVKEVVSMHGNPLYHFKKYETGEPQ